MHTARTTSHNFSPIFSLSHTVCVCAYETGKQKRMFNILGIWTHDTCVWILFLEDIFLAYKAHQFKPYCDLVGILSQKPLKNLQNGRKWMTRWRTQNFIQMHKNSLSRGFSMGEYMSLCVCMSECQYLFYMQISLEAQPQWILNSGFLSLSLFFQIYPHIRLEFDNPKKKGTTEIKSLFTLFIFLFFALFLSHSVAKSIQIWAFKCT